MKGFVLAALATAGYGRAIRLVRPLLTPAMLRWWIVGIAFVGVNLALLYLLVDVLGLAVFVATVIATEVGTVLRFLVNDRWVFNHPRPTWRRLWQYHLATAGGIAVWLTTTNLLVNLGIHYAIASVLGMGCSVLVSVATNFLWIWRHQHKKT